MIQIDRQRRLTLLRWLKQGYIEEREIASLNPHNLTAGELSERLDRLIKANPEGQCNRMKRLGLCPYNDPTGANQVIP